MNSESDTKLSITIVHHHGLQMLKDCLASIYDNAPQCSFETVIVDNVSTDGARDFIEAEYKQIRLIKNTERHGFGHNQNTALKAASGQYLFILNDDTIIRSNALDELVKFLDEHENVALVGPRLLNSDGSLQKSCYKFPSPLRYIFENLLLTAAFPTCGVFGDYRKWAHDEPRSIDFVIGAAMLVRREVIDQIGYFDTSFFMYSEETDWQMRIRKAGWEIMFDDKAEIIHVGGQSSEGMKDKQFCEFNSSAVKLMRKHYGLPGLLIQRITMIVGAVLRIGLWTAISVIPSKRKKSLETVATWSRLLSWWLGMGPHEGLAPKIISPTVAQP